ncbi:NAD(P)/FAD-dependent oxidoreductase [Tundrisphaera lichenicola]|uniref:NAD(P)/FAD-dependent oxidoreductase n=1 Tax=Tundrisphaera lichenicola TaxID=2029860 RepID=UPI003EBD35D1
MALRVGIIGAGIAGLTLASRLSSAGHSVLVIDKGRGVGGRASTRRGEVAPFDHGAQYFTARDPKFREFLDARIPPEHLALWEGRFAILENGRIMPETSEEPRLVGVPGMNSIARSIAASLPIRVGAKAVGLEGSPGNWSIAIEADEKVGPFDWVVSTAPPAQSSTLLAGRSPMAEEARRVEMRPCFALMLVPSGEASLPIDGIRCDHPVLGWAAIDGSKPGRPVPNALVIQSNHDWAEAHVDDEPASVIEALKTAASEAFGVDFGTVAFESLHRWLYAKPVEPLGRSCLIDHSARLAIAGDWCLAAKVEGAFRSGDACSRLLLGDSP